MENLTKDIITILGGIGGVIGVFITGYKFAGSRNGYVKEEKCDKTKDELKKDFDNFKADQKKEISSLHEKINHVSDRTSEIDGQLKVLFKLKE